MTEKAVKASSAAKAADSDIKRWSAKRKAQVVVDILKGKRRPQRSPAATI